MLTFSSGITAIIGANGVGKSTIAAAIADLLIGSRSKSQEVRVFGSTLSGRGLFRGEAINPRIEEIYDEPGESGRDEENTDFEIDQPLPATSFAWLDPTFSTNILNMIHEDADFQSVLEGISPREASKEDLEHLSYLVNKEYKSCLTYEIEDYRSKPPFPYFRVRSGDIEYSTESMGSGELSLLIYFCRKLSGF